MKNETRHTTGGEAMTWLISMLGEIWLADERFPSSRSIYTGRIRWERQARDLRALPTQGLYTLLISCLHTNICDRKTIENRPKIQTELNETRKVHEDFL